MFGDSPPITKLVPEAPTQLPSFIAYCKASQATSAPQLTVRLVASLLDTVKLVILAYAPTQEIVVFNSIL